MHATITHLAIWLPDWNSLDSVRRADSDLEGAALVFFALLVFCEALAHLSDDKKTERRFDKIGIVFFAMAVLAEIVAYPYGQRNDTLSEQVIGSLDVKARNAANNASTALNNSKEAETKSSDAVDKAGKAQKSAHDARQEADSFDARIVSATNKATEAESHLAGALHEATEAQAELNRLKTPRSLTNPSALISVLEAFKRTEYTFVGAFSDEDSITLLKEIDTALQLAGWKRQPPPLKGGIVLTIGKDFQVPPDVRTGVRMEVESTEKLEVLKQLPTSALPRYIQAGAALKRGLYASIMPTQEDLNTPLGVNQGTSTVVAILVGKKP